MAKIKLSGSVTFIFVLCGCAAVVSGSGSSESAHNNLSTSPIEHLEGLVKYFKAAEERNREQEKVIEELKEQFKSSQEKCNEQFNSLSKQFEEFKSKMSEDSGVWLLTPPLRGSPGKPGEKGDRGLTGPQGKAGENGQPGPKGERGISALESSITSCSVAKEALPSPRSKKQTLYPHGNSMSLEVLCDFETDGGGWTIIQKRTSGPKDEFDRTWNDYKNGFGSLEKNFWLGLENIRALTKNVDQELRIELADFDGNKRWAKYSSFSISDASDFYRLSVGGYFANSTAGDSLTVGNGGPSNGMRFTTKDKDHDNWSGGNNCAAYQGGGGGGWWFNNCGSAGLNGLYFEKGETVTHWRGIFWEHWKGLLHSLAKTEMKIRTRKP